MWDNFLYILFILLNYCKFNAFYFVYFGKKQNSVKVKIPQNVKIKSMGSPNTVVNLAGKLCIINKNFEKGALMTIVNKLQTDLSQIKYLARDESDTSHFLETPNSLELTPEKKYSMSGSSSFHSPGNAELKLRLRKNYEEKVENLIKLYETKLEEYKTKVKYLEDDREAFVEALQNKHSIILKIKNENSALIEAKNLEISELKQSYENELAQLKNELIVTETCYNDLEQVRKFLEKNNNTMKQEIQQTQQQCEEKILKIAEEYEKEKLKYKNETKQVRASIELAEKQNEQRIGELEQQSRLNSKEFELEIDRLTAEMTEMKQQVKLEKEERQKLENEQQSGQETLAHTTIYYETKINNLIVSAKKDKEHYYEELEEIKERYEKKFAKLEDEYTALERDVDQKTKEFMDCENLKKKLVVELTDLRGKYDVILQKHENETQTIQRTYEEAKKNYEAEIMTLKTNLLDKEKIVDDLDIANKKYEKQYNGLKSTIKTMKDEFEEDNTKMWDKLKNEKIFYQEEMMKVKADYAARFKKQDEDLVKMKEEANNFIETIEKLENSKRSLEKHNRDLKVNMETIFDEYKDEIDRLSRETETKSYDYEANIEKLEAELQKLQKSVQNYEETNKVLLITNDEYKTIIADAAVKYSTDVGRLKDEIEMTRRFHADDISSIQKQLELKEQFEKEKDERIQKLKQEITTIKSAQTMEIDEKVENLERIRKDLETENTILKHRVNDLSEDFKIQKETYETSHERIKKRHDDERQKIREENDNLNNSIEVLEKTVQDQERENKLLRKNLEDISKKQSDETLELVENLTYTRTKYDEKLHKLKQELETNRRNYEDDLEKARNEFHTDRQQYEERIQELRQECNSRKVVYQELENAKKELEENWKIIQSDEFKKLAYLGAMGKMKFVEQS